MSRMKQASRFFALAAPVLIVTSVVGGCEGPQEEAMEDEAEAMEAELDAQVEAFEDSMESQASKDDGESEPAQRVPEL